jgi:heme/copper-type cytochrome/quinol oxidase subunit 4
MKKILLILLIITASLPIFSLSAKSANLSDAFSTNLSTVAGDSGAGYKTTTSIDNIASIIITTILSLLGVLFLALMVYGGFLWMSDRGNSDQVGRAQKLMTAAIIGLIIVLGSYAISYFVLDSISTQTLEESSSTEEGTTNEL